MVLYFRTQTIVFIRYNLLVFDFHVNMFDHCVRISTDVDVLEAGAMVGLPVLAPCRSWQTASSSLWVFSAQDAVPFGTLYLELIFVRGVARKCGTPIILIMKYSHVRKWNLCPNIFRELL